MCPLAGRSDRRARHGGGRRVGPVQPPGLAPHPSGRVGPWASGALGSDIRPLLPEVERRVRPAAARSCRSCVAAFSAGPAAMNSNSARSMPDPAWSSPFSTAASGPPATAPTSATTTRPPHRGPGRRRSPDGDTLWAWNSVCGRSADVVTPWCVPSQWVRRSASAGAGRERHAGRVRAGSPAGRGPAFGSPGAHDHVDEQGLVGAPAPVGGGRGRCVGSGDVAGRLGAHVGGHVGDGRMLGNGDDVRHRELPDHLPPHLPPLEPGAQGPALVTAAGGTRAPGRRLLAENRRRPTTASWPHRREKAPAELPARKEGHNASQRKVRARPTAAPSP